jgi:hypothetical protein
MKIVLPAALLAGFAAAAFAAQGALADQPGAHPAYLHALSDLRNARANLERKPGDAEVKWDESRAIADIDAAIGKIKAASIDDGKNLSDHPPIDASEPRRGRLHKALDALHAAHRDIKREEDNAYAQGLRGRALADIDHAINRTKEGLCDAGDTNFCPK